jgi:transglutaminase-like putative cysteine protease
MLLKARAYFTYEIIYPTHIIALLSPRIDVNDQVITRNLDITPSTEIDFYFDVYGNECHRFLLEVGRVEITSTCEVEVHDTIEKNFEAAYIPIEFLPSELFQYLLPSRYCFSDTFEIRNLASQIVAGLPNGYAQAEAIRTWVHQNISYQYGFSLVTTHSNHILKDKVGVCRDFAHLAIALCRSLNIPSRIVVGFAKDLPFADLHAWFECYVGDQWYIFDAVQTETTPGRIVLAYGRDASDVAFITQYGSSLMVGMHVEVTG